jgi:hypothetical protein
MKIALSGFGELGLEGQDINGVDFSQMGSLSDILRTLNRDGLRNLIHSLNQCDFWIVRLTGENPFDLISQLKRFKLLDEFSSRSFRAAFWSADSHHFWKEEVKAAKYFDLVFISHSPYLVKFPQEKVHHLPCAFDLSDGRSLEELAIKSIGLAEELNGLEVISPFSIYPRARRNLTHFRLSRELDEAGIGHFFGTARGGGYPSMGLISAILKSKLVLNLSLADDLNMRNFEALSLGRILVANAVPDSEFLANQGTVFLAQDASPKELLRIIKVGLASSSEKRGGLVSVDNSLRARLVSALAVMGVEDKLLPVKFRTAGRAINEASSPIVIDSHRPAKLLGFSPLSAIRISDLKLLIRTSGWKSVFELVKWVLYSQFRAAGTLFFKIFPRLKLKFINFV